MKISIIGASGFVGRNLISSLLSSTNHDIIAIALDTNKIEVDEKYKNRIKLINTDILDSTQIKIALIGSEVSFYLIHMLNQNGKFYDRETEAAEIVGKALFETKVKKVIYMSGLGNDKDVLSEHLASRHNTGRILSKYLPTIEFRASMIIGAGSASYEIARNIINKAPVILVPKKSITKTQPIGINDILSYLISAISLSPEDHMIIEIGGPKIMSYVEFLEKINTFNKRNVTIIRIPFLPEIMAGWFLNFFTNKYQARIGKNMIKSFQNEMIVTNNKAKELFPDITPKPIEDSFI